MIATIIMNSFFSSLSPIYSITKPFYLFFSQQCARLIITDAERDVFIRKLRNPNIESGAKVRLYQKLVKMCRKNLAACPHCGAVNGLIRKIGPVKLLHDVFNKKARFAVEAANQFQKNFDYALECNKELEPHMSKVQDDLNPVRVLNLFTRMTTEDIMALDFEPFHGTPSRMILTHLLVPPACIRPSVQMESAMGSNEDDLTVKLSDIVALSKEIEKSIERGISFNTVMEQWDNLQLKVGLYINSELPRTNTDPRVNKANASTKAARGLCQRLKGKHGRFRGNLSGKRVNFSGRTVISPDPNLAICEVGVPRLIAMKMTYPEHVTAQNIELMRQLVRNGPEVHPGANFVVQLDGTRRFLKYCNREDVAEHLRIGEVVERHMHDGDPVLFNRQPSLHKMSIMSHRARIMPYRTLRFNESVCTPYNADFDGDEMNIHLPQTEEARAEAEMLMQVTHNLCTPRTGDILVASTQDFLTTGYLVTQRSVFYDRATFCRYCASMFDADVQVDLPPPAVVKPAELWTGKQLFSVLLKPKCKTRRDYTAVSEAELAGLIDLNWEGKSKTFGYKGIKYLDPDDGWVVFQNSELLCGILDKGTLGGGSKNCIFHVLLREYGVEVAADCMRRVSKFSARWIGERGFSIGIEDVMANDEVKRQFREIMRKGYAECDELIKKYNDGTLETQAGLTPEESVEGQLTGKLSELRDKAGMMCLAALPSYNAPLIMAFSGSKGSTINVSQMVACVGQQVLNGSRIPNGFLNRTLPHFGVNAKEPAAKGFVLNSFFSGMNGTEFFFHTMSGREGLVDTAVKTAETGYMQRRLMKAFEELRVHYDDTVRNASGGILQLIFGDDSLDPSRMEAADMPTNFETTWMNIAFRHPCAGEPVLPPREVEERLEKAAVAGFAGCPTLYVDKVKEFVRKTFVAPMELLVKDAEEQTAARATRQAPSDTKMEVDEESGGSGAVKPEAAALARLLAERVCPVTATQLRLFLETCHEKFLRAKCEPGTAVGAICGQSIGEPTTQMTLKTFHFAGVASMNVTLGVPRIKEIINAAKSISTPIITAELVDGERQTAARIVKGRIEKTVLGEIVDSLKEVYHPSGGCYLSVVLAKDTIEKLQLGNIDANSVRRSILEARSLRMKLKEKNIAIAGKWQLHVYPVEQTKGRLAFSLLALRRSLPLVPVCGVRGVNRAIISREHDAYQLQVEGDNLADVMVTPGVRGEHTTCNHILEVADVLGIEAARTTIISEMVNVLKNHGLSIDTRHLTLLADLMTSKGVILGITRFGISKMAENVLMMASFERTTDFLFDAAVHSKIDDVIGVSDSVIVGNPVSVGTGLFKVLLEPEIMDTVKPKPRRTLF